MKTLRLTLLSLLVVALVTACSEEEISIDKPSTPPVASFTATPSTVNPNYIALEITSQGEGVLNAWRFRDESSFARDTEGLDTAYYPEPGTYTITLLSGNDAGVDSISQEVVIAQRDVDLPDPNAEAFLLLGDFEDGEVGDWNAWAQDVTVADNPAPSSVNSSDKVLKITQMDAFSQSANRSIPVVTDKATKISIDVFFEVSGSLKLQIEAPFETGFFQDVEAGSWVTLEYDLEGQVDGSTEYPWILIQGNTAGNYYIDNIKYFALDIVAGGQRLGDFEDGEVGDWNAWGQAVTVEDNPDPDAVNSSDKVLKMTQADPFSQSANRSIPIVTENAKKITLDVYFEVAGSLKLQIEAPFETGFFQDVEAGDWVTLEYNLEGQVNGDTEYPWILIQGNTAGNYYIDNITYFE